MRRGNHGLAEASVLVAGEPDAMAAKAFNAGEPGQIREIDMGRLTQYGQPLSSRLGCVTAMGGRLLVEKFQDEAAQKLLTQLNGRCPLVCGPMVLLAMFIRDSVVRMPSGVTIHLPDIVRAEDKFQGKVGLVLALGPTAYVDDKFRTFHYPWVLPGDWVVYPAYENSHGRFDLDGITMATVPDETIKLIVPAPELVR